MSIIQNCCDRVAYGVGGTFTGFGAAMVWTLVATSLYTEGLCEKTIACSNSTETSCKLLKTLFKENIYTPPSSFIEKNLTQFNVLQDYCEMKGDYDTALLVVASVLSLVALHLFYKSVCCR